MRTGAFGTCARIQHGSSIRVHNAVSCINVFQSICIIIIKKKKSNSTKRTYLLWWGKKKKRQKGLDLEISSKCQASWSSKHKYQDSFLIVGTKMTKTNTVPQVISQVCVGSAEDWGTSWRLQLYSSPEMTIYWASSEVLYETS